MRLALFFLAICLCAVGQPFYIDQLESRNVLIGDSSQMPITPLNGKLRLMSPLYALPTNGGILTLEGDDPSFLTWKVTIADNCRVDIFGNITAGNNLYGVNLGLGGGPSFNTAGWDGTQWYGNGYGLTNLNAINLTNTIPLSTLPTNIAYMNSNNIFINPNTFANRVYVRTNTAAGMSQSGGMSVSADLANPSVNALFLMPPFDGARCFFGTSGATYYAIDWYYVSYWNNVPSLLQLKANGFAAPYEGRIATSIYGGGGNGDLALEAAAGDGYISGPRSPAMRREMMFYFAGHNSDTYKMNGGFMFIASNTPAAWTNWHTSWNKANSRTDYIMTLDMNGNLATAGSTTTSNGLYYKIAQTNSTADTGYTNVWQPVHSFAAMMMYTTNTINGGAGTYAIVTNYTTARSNLMGCSLTTGYITNTIAGFYRVGVHLSGLALDNSATVEGDLLLNGVVKDEVSFVTVFDNPPRTKGMSAIGILYITNNTPITFQVKSSGASGISVLRAQMVIGSP